MFSEYEIKIDQADLSPEEMEIRFHRGMEMVLPKQQIINILNSKRNEKQKSNKNKGLIA